NLSRRPGETLEQYETRLAEQRVHQDDHETAKRADFLNVAADLFVCSGLCSGLSVAYKRGVYPSSEAQGRLAPCFRCSWNQ
ncbi:hypothetical protein SAMN05216388_11183, partial [Halorientalis persicus]